MRVVLIVFLLVFISFSALADGECPNGYALISDSDVTKGGLVSTTGGGCYGGYQLYSANYAIVQPRIMTHPGRCGANKYYLNGNCVDYTVGSCETGYFNETPAVQSGTFDTIQAGGCLGGYSAMNTKRITGYVVMSSATQKCATGYYPTANGCVAHPVDNCPNNYYAISPSSAFVRISDDAECPTNYSTYTDTDLCRKYLGVNMAKFCTPQLLCAAGPTTLRSSTGMILPMYRERATAPSIHVGFTNGDICYVNLLPGSATGTINLGDALGNTYHGVE